MEQTIYSNEFLAQTGKPYFTIEVRRDEDFIRVSWVGFINEEKAKKGLVEETDVIQKTGIKKVLVDNRGQTGPFPKEIGEFMIQEIIPRLETMGSIRVGQILSENVFTEFSAKNMENDQEINDKQVMNIANFPDEVTAINWLNG